MSAPLSLIDAQRESLGGGEEEQEEEQEEEEEGIGGGETLGGFDDLEWTDFLCVDESGLYVFFTEDRLMAGSAG